MLAPRASRRNLYLNIQAPQDAANEAETFSRLNNVLGQRGRQVDMRRLDRHEGLLQLTYLMDCRYQEDLTQLMADLQEAAPGCSYSLIDQQTLPEL